MFAGMNVKNKTNKNKSQKSWENLKKDQKKTNMKDILSKDKELSNKTDNLPKEEII